jgi:hypothetical protein
MVKPQSEYVRSENGEQIGKRPLSEIRRRVQVIDDRATI